MKKDNIPHAKSAESVAQPGADHAHPQEHSHAPEGYTRKKEYSSRFVYAHQDVTYPGENSTVHTRPFHIVVYCITGSADYQLNGEHYAIARGDILSIPAETTYTMTVTDPQAEPYRRYELWLSSEFSQLIRTLFLTDNVPAPEVAFLLHTAGTVWEPLSEYFRHCVQECEQQLFRWDASVFGIATELAVQMARAWQGNYGDTAPKPELLDRIMSHVEAHLSEKITLPDIAARFWVSQSTVSQLFRKKMGISFYRYVTTRRLQESQVLIRSGMPMDQVSISVGFQDYSTFYRAFKSEYGISPAQYRKNH